MQNLKLYGKKIGTKFSDKEFNDSWNMDKIIVYSNGKYLNSL